jgi:hypothetical protein
MIALAPTTANRLALPAPSPADDLVRLFLDGRKATTVNAYRQSLDDFAHYLGAPTIDAAARLLIGRGHGGANHLVMNYRADLIGRGRAPAMINARLAASADSDDVAGLRSADPEPFKAAIAQYLEKNNMAMALKAIKAGPTVEGKSATLTASFQHATMPGAAVTWTLHFEQNADGTWNAVSRE